jgi:hypothetical protein
LPVLVDEHLAADDQEVGVLVQALLDLDVHALEQRLEVALAERAGEAADQQRVPLAGRVRTAG